MNREKLIAIIKAQMIEQGAVAVESDDAAVGIDYGLIFCSDLADAILAQCETLGVGDCIQFSTELLKEIDQMPDHHSQIVEIVSVQREGVTAQTAQPVYALLVKNVQP